MPRQWGHLEYHTDQTREEPRYFILQLMHKERASKVARTKHYVMYKGMLFRITVSLPTKITITRKTQNSFQVTKESTRNYCI